MGHYIMCCTNEFPSIVGEELVIIVPSINVCVAQAIDVLG